MINNYDDLALKKYLEGSLLNEQKIYFEKKLTSDLQLFKDQLKQHIDGKITGTDLKKIKRDIFVNTDSLSLDYLALSPKSANECDAFISWLSMYESNELNRGGEFGYIGDEELQKYVADLLKVFPELPLK